MNPFVEEEFKQTPEGEEGFFAIAKNAPDPDEEGFFHKVSEYGKTALKGTVEGISRFGLAFGPLYEPEKTTEQRQQKQTETLEELIPQEEEDYLQTILREGLRGAPTMAAFPGAGLGAIPREFGAAFLGETAKEFGAPEWAQNALKLTAYIGPDLTKKLLEKGKNKEIIKIGKDLGLNEDEIAPLLKKDFKEKWLSKFSPKRGRTQKILEKTKGKIDVARDKISELPGSKELFDQETTSTFLKELGEKALDIPASVRNKAAQDAKDMLKTGVSPASVMNFWVDLNHEIGKGADRLGVLKGPIRNILEKSNNPEILKAFDDTNKLYSRYYKIAGKLNPDFINDFVTASEIFGIGEGLREALFYGNPTFLKAMLLEKGARIGAREVLLNPRFQQLGEKTLMALNKNKFGLAKKLIDNMRNELIKMDPSLKGKLDELTLEDYEKLQKS